MGREIENALKFLKNGNKKFQIISLEPLNFKNLHINQGHGPVAIDLLFPDVNFHGLSDGKISEVTNDWKQMKAKAYFKTLHLKGEYEISGKVLVLPIQGKGPCDIEFDDMTVNVTIDFQEIEKNKKQVFDVKKFHIELQPKKTVYSFQNLFNGNKALGDNMNVFLNENSRELLEELKPAFSKGFDAILAKISNLVFHKLPVDELRIP